MKTFSMFLSFSFVVVILICLQANCEAFYIQPKWNVKFEENNLEVNMNTIRTVGLQINGIDKILPQYSFHLKSENPTLASVDKVIKGDEFDGITNSWNGQFNISVHFLGTTKIFVELHDVGIDLPQQSQHNLNLIIIRQVRLIDNLFNASVGIFVSFLYINFGAALDLVSLRKLLIRPIGPTIGLFGQFVIMPLLSFALGYALFPDMLELRLGLFFTGVSPGGGASNIFTLLLNGNINLSIAMTSISNLAALAMMPLWIFTLGTVIFDGGNVVVPYKNIALFSASLIIPLSIGIATKKWFPKLANILVAALKPISFFIILFIMAFAITTNSFLFKLFSWQIVLAGMGLPYFGYLFSWLIAKFLNQSPEDSLTIAIETGIQNTGIAIFLLRFTLPQPYADLTSVIPVACSMMAPGPLLIVLLIQKLFKSKSKKIEEDRIENEIIEHNELIVKNVA